MGLDFFVCVLGLSGHQIGREQGFTASKTFSKAQRILYT